MLGLLLLITSKINGKEVPLFTREKTVSLKKYVNYISYNYSTLC